MIKKFFVVLILMMLPVLASAESYEIGEVVIEGNQRVERNAILSELTIEPGETITPAEIDRNIRAIYGLGRFEDVVAEIEERNGIIILIFRVVEHPLVRRIEFAGNDELSREKLSDLVTFRAPDIYSREKVERSIEEIEKAYSEEGFYAATVESKIDIDDRNEATITFEIEEGEKVFISDIRFEGNTVFSFFDFEGNRRLVAIIDIDLRNRRRREGFHQRYPFRRQHRLLRPGIEESHSDQGTLVSVLAHQSRCLPTRGATD